MKRPTAASLRKVTAENLANLGVGKLAEILVVVAETRPEVKRRLRMELAALQGAESLSLEIDRRLGTLTTSRSRISWRQRPTFVRDLDGLRGLVAGPLADLDAAAALERLWRLMSLAGGLGLRMRDRDGELAAVFRRAAGDIGVLAGRTDGPAVAEGLVAALTVDPQAWLAWLPVLLAAAPPDLAGAALTRLSARADATQAWVPLIRALADAAGDVDAYRATYSTAALRDPAVVAEVAQRLLAADRTAEAGKLLAASAPSPGAKRRLTGQRDEAPDFDWETAWIDYLERSGQADEAQRARWASFERTLSAERARAFTERLADFADVEAEARAFDHARGQADPIKGLAFLIDWPALGEAARMIEGRADELRPSPEQAELWAARLRTRYPAAAYLLLRKAAAAAFRRGAFATADRLTAEAEAIAP